MSELYIEDIEYHRVNLTKRYTLDEDDVIEEFGSVEQFKKLFDEGDENARDYVYQGDYETTDEDWWTMNKGGYDIDTTTSWEQEEQ